MKEKHVHGLSRRQFLESAAVGLAGISIIPSLGSCSQKQDKGDSIRLGFIGLGRQAMFLLNGFIQFPNVKVVAGCDVYGIKRQRFENVVKRYNKNNNIKSSVLAYEKYQDMIESDNIDAVVIATPDHLHAIIAIAACKAGKDVYLEKPLTFTIKEGQELRRVVRETNRILAVGSQQRSDSNFRHAVELVQSGTLGNIERVNAYVGNPPVPYKLPEEPVPSDLNWDLWLGPLPESIHYNKELNPPISLDPVKNEGFWGGWRWYKEMGGGFTTDWGAHMFDIAQWGLNMDGNGPIEISPIGDGTEFISFKYANGVVMTSEPFDEKMSKGVMFLGDKGWIEVSRGHFAASDNAFVPKQKNTRDKSFKAKIPHQVDFIDAICENRDPIVPVEIGHNTCVVCTLGNIACDLGRTIKWNPVTETFVDDVTGDATAQLHYKYRSGWSLL